MISSSMLPSGSNTKFHGRQSRMRRTSCDQFSCENRQTIFLPLAIWIEIVVFTEYRHFCQIPFIKPMAKGDRGKPMAPKKMKRKMRKIRKLGARQAMWLEKTDCKLKHEQSGTLCKRIEGQYFVCSDEISFHYWQFIVGSSWLETGAKESRGETW